MLCLRLQLVFWYCGSQNPRKRRKRGTPNKKLNAIANIPLQQVTLQLPSNEPAWGSLFLVWGGCWFRVEGARLEVVLQDGISCVGDENSVEGRSRS